MDATKLPKGQSKERYTDNRPINEPGTYKHKDTGAVYITAPGEEGIIQADALMSPLWQDAWERVGDVPSRIELLAMQKAQLQKDAVLDKAAKAKEEAEIDEALKKLQAETDDNPEPGKGATFTPGPAKKK